MSVQTDFAECVRGYVASVVVVVDDEESAYDGVARSVAGWSNDVVELAKLENSDLALGQDIPGLRTKLMSCGAETEAVVKSIFGEAAGVYSTIGVDHLPHNRDSVALWEFGASNADNADSAGVWQLVGDNSIFYGMAGSHRHLNIVGIDGSPNSCEQALGVMAECSGMMNIIVHPKGGYVDDWFADEVYAAAFAVVTISEGKVTSSPRKAVSFKDLKAAVGVCKIFTVNMVFLLTVVPISVWIYMGFGGLPHAVRCTFSLLTSLITVVNIERSTKTIVGGNGKTLPCMSKKGDAESKSCLVAATLSLFSGGPGLGYLLAVVTFTTVLVKVQLELQKIFSSRSARDGKWRLHLYCLGTAVKCYASYMWLAADPWGKAVPRARRQDDHCRRWTADNVGLREPPTLFVVLLVLVVLLCVLLQLLVGDGTWFYYTTTGVTAFALVAGGWVSEQGRIATILQCVLFLSHAGTLVELVITDSAKVFTLPSSLWQAARVVQWVMIVVVVGLTYVGGNYPARNELASYVLTEVSVDMEWLNMLERPPRISSSGSGFCHWANEGAKFGSRHKPFQGPASSTRWVVTGVNDTSQGSKWIGS